jgi:ferredoxin--NADP+ reductase
MTGTNRHVVAVIGGAVSGSVAAEILAENGIEVLVIEQNARPYGKIEDGLPRWHAVQRDKEYGKIHARLDREGIHFIPETKLGRDVDFKDLTEEWGLSAVLLANGAWRDRPFLNGECDEIQWEGFVYQNPFIHWFNHYHESDYDGPDFEVPDGAVVFGGGLASIDCVKVCQFNNAMRAFKARGVDVSLHDLDKKGIPALCEANGLTVEDLGLKNAVLYYRRRVQDMPLAQPPANATPEQMEKTLAARAKLLERAQERYLFRVQDKTLPLEVVLEDGRCVGVKIQRTEVEGRKATPIEGTEEIIPTELIISSIGSVPEKIAGINTKGETYTFSDWDLGVYAGADGVFGVGNVVTGQGNIRASLMHSRTVTNYLAEHYFASAAGAATAEAVTEHLSRKDPLSAEAADGLIARAKDLQAKVGYTGFKGWIEANAAAG